MLVSGLGRKDCRMVEPRAAGPAQALLGERQPLLQADLRRGHALCSRLLSLRAKRSNLVPTGKQRRNRPPDLVALGVNGISMVSTMQCAGKVVLVTGAQQGIGRAMAVEFAAEGADVAVDWLDDAEAARHVAEEVQARGRRTLLVKADVSRIGDVRAMVSCVAPGL